MEKHSQTRVAKRKVEWRHGGESCSPVLYSVLCLKYGLDPAAAILQNRLLSLMMRRKECARAPRYL